MDAPTNSLETCCVYCGDFNECQDHVVCVAWNSGNRKLDDGKTVNCCNMCNNLLGDFYGESVYIKAIKLEELYQDELLKFPLAARWTRTEIDELSGHLKTHIEKQQFRKLLLDAKLANLARVLFGYPPNPIRAVYKRREVTEMVKVFR